MKNSHKAAIQNLFELRLELYLMMRGKPLAFQKELDKGIRKIDRKITEIGMNATKERKCKHHSPTSGANHQ